MKITRNILIKSLVKTFYRQHAGLLVFIFFIMVLAVGRANEAGLLEYHVALIRGMMINPVIFCLVLLAWLIYAGKCEQYISSTLRRRDFAYLRILTVMHTGRLFWLLLLVQALIYLPVLSYVAVIAAVGIHQHAYKQVAIVLSFNIAICFVIARWFLYQVQHPEYGSFIPHLKLPAWITKKYYWSFFLRDVLANRKMLLLVIKLYNCGMLYLMVTRQLREVYDIRVILLFYSFGLLGHGVIIHHFRELEETRLTFYRSLPVSLPSRFMQYVFLYGLLFIPEMATISYLTPAYLHLRDGLLFLLLGYSVLILLNSLLFIKPFGRKEYLKIMVVLFFMLFLAVLTKSLIWLILLFLLFSVYIFNTRYYRYERI